MPDSNPYYQGYANQYSCYSKATARQNIVQKNLVNDNIVLNYPNANNIDLFPTIDYAEKLNRVGNNQPFQEILRNWKIPFIKEASGYFSLDSDKYQIARDYSSKVLRLYEDSNSPGFYPFNNLNTSYNPDERNYNYTMRIDVPFYMSSDGKIFNKETKQMEDMVFSFSGDDDVWVFIDDKLILDIGGMHPAVTGNINFCKNQSYVSRVYNAGTANYLNDSYCIDNAYSNNVFGANGLSEGKHTLKLFYTERGAGESNFSARFNLIQIKSFSGTKTWKDDDNSLKLRPSSYTLKLYGDGKYLQEKTFKTSNWSFDNLLKYNSETGKEIVYTVKEDEIPLQNGDKYVPTIDGNSVVNTLTGSSNVEIVKQWEDLENKNNTRPDNIEACIKNGSSVFQKFTISKNDNWKKTLTVPKYDNNGKVINYTVDENVVPSDYTKSIDGFTIKNILNKYKYRVEYYFDNIIDNSLTENFSEYKNTQITSYPDKLDKKPFYKFDKVENLGMIVSENEDENVIKVYYNHLDFNLSVNKKLTKIVLNGNDIPATNKLEINRKEPINSLKLHYLISVSNNGQIDGSTTVCDIIPDGFSLLPEDNKSWKIDGNKASIDIKKIVVGETKDFEIVLTANSSDVLGTITNIATIENSKCEPGFDESNLDDNKSIVDSIIGISTGLKDNLVLILSCTLVVLLVCCVCLLILKKKHNKK